MKTKPNYLKGAEVPYHLLEKARDISKWCDSQGIDDWKILGIQKRVDEPTKCPHCGKNLKK